jgi:hypothetical protein
MSGKQFYFLAFIVFVVAVNVVGFIYHKEPPKIDPPVYRLPVPYEPHYESGKLFGARPSADSPEALAPYAPLPADIEVIPALKHGRRPHALERAASRTREQQQATDVPRVPAADDKVAKPAIPLPPTGDIGNRYRRNAIAPLIIQTKSGSNFLVKLVNVTNSKDQIWVFVRGGEPYSTKVPIGKYALRVASGYAWYGREELFGPDTRFFRLRGKKGAAVDESLVLEFKKERNRIVGHTLSFEGSVDGNMEQEGMTRSEFDAN